MYKFNVYITVYTTKPKDEMYGDVFVTKRWMQHLPPNDIECTEISKYHRLYEGHVMAENTDDAFEKAVQWQRNIVDSFELF